MSEGISAGEDERLFRRRTGLERASAALAKGIVTRVMVEDNLVDRAMLEVDPLWEMDWPTGNWVRRTPQFLEDRAMAVERLPAEREAAVIALNVALLKLEADLPAQADGPRYAVFRCGDHAYAYEVIASWDQGEIATHRTSGEAIQEWRRRLLACAATHPGDNLWWRCRPEIEGQIRFGDTAATWRVYSRLVIGSGTPSLGEDIYVRPSIGSSE